MQPDDAIARAQQLSEAALKLAVRAQIISTAKHSASPNDIVRDAMFVLAHDSICVHRATDLLVLSGWSSPAAALVRTLLDLTVSMLAILNGASPRLNAFKYLYSNFRRLGRDMARSPAHRARIRQQVRERIAQLPAGQRQDAIKAYAEKDRAYWFAPEWQSPAAVIEQFGVPGMGDFYRQFSAAAHGGFFGLRLFRDDPDRMDINQRTPPGKHALSVVYVAAKLLVELTRGRDAYEKLALDAECSRLTQQINAAALAP